MTHEELLADIQEQIKVRKELGLGDIAWSWNALRAVVELHKPFRFETEPGEYRLVCKHCQLGVVGDEYPCETIKAIEKELA